MAYGYLLAPSFQFVNINGRPIANGHIEVFLTNTDTKYITKCDFNGTDNPFKIPLNSKGMAVVIASGDYAYDVFCYDRFGSLFWSGSNIRIEGATGVVIDGANLPLRIVGGKIDNNGKELTCTGENAWAEGAETTASGANAHAEGGLTTASGEHSHSEGFSTTASSGYCHAEGAGSKASNTASHAEGQDTTASGQASHAEGRGSVASGDYSHASGRGTRATGEGSTAVGKWNDDGDALFVVGGGTASNNRKDVFKVDRNGDTWVLVNNSLVRVNNCSQFVLTRSNMTTAFTNDEYSDCVNSVTNGIAVCVQVGTSLQLQLTQIDSLGIHFDATFGDYHYTYVVAPTTNAHTISENIRHFGTPIYATLQDAISDADALLVGMYFETNGFHTSGDGGAARYRVSSTGTANGMDIVQLASGKLAILQVNANREMYPEQFGYKRDTNRNDLTPYLVRMTTMPNTPVRNIRLMPTGSSNAVYVMRTTWNITASDVSIIGHSGFSTGHATRIWFVPYNYETNHTPMFKFGQRGFVMKNLVILNRSWFDDGDKHNCVCLYMAITNTNKMWYDFDQLAIQGFDIGIAKVYPENEKVDGLMWHCEFHRLQLAQNNKNIYFKALVYVTKFDNCFLTTSESNSQSVSIEESFTLEFDRCNFGIYNPADTILRFNKFIVENAPVDVRWSSAKFTNCNFEIEVNDSHPLPTSNSGYFLKCDDDDDFHLEFDNCFFISTPLARENKYGNRAFSLGNNTSIKITNCCGSYADVNYSGNEYYEWDFQKRMFDGTRPPKKEVGSVIIQHSLGIITPPNNQWGSAHLPIVKTDEMTCQQSDNNTNFLENYPNAKDGVLLLNLDKASLETKMGNSIIQVTSPSSNKVRIGDRIYDYVVIDGRKWITTNLQLWTMGNRQWHYPLHKEYGFYYGTNCFDEIDSLLPAGWRRPTLADCTSLVNQGAYALQKTGYSVWSGATNSSGFSAIPSDKWNKPNVTPNFTRVFLWGYEESGVGWHTIYINPTQVSIGGWTYSEASNRQCNLRVCADV